MSDSEAEENGVEMDDEAPTKDGLADMMAKILGQNVQGKVPVLAKRKTSIMKEIEEGRDDRERLKKQRIERKTDREKQMVIPDQTSMDYERQLRKLATRGGKNTNTYLFPSFFCLNKGFPPPFSHTKTNSGCFI